MERNSKNILLDKWPMVIGIATFIFSGGVFYSEQRSLAERVHNVEDRSQRQYETIRDVNKNIEELKLWQAYHKGYEEARKDYLIKP